MSATNPSATHSSATPLAATILIPLPDRDFDITEVAVPWRLLTRAGHHIVFATEDGRVAEGDPRLLKGVVLGQLGAAPDACEFYREMIRSPAFCQPIHWQAIEPALFDAMLLPGGHAPGMRQYLGSRLLQQKVAAFWALQRPVAAICHGVLLLARARDAQGKSLLHNCSTTSLRKWQECTAWWLTRWWLGNYYRTYEKWVEDEVCENLDAPTAQYQKGPFSGFKRGSEHDNNGAFVVRDGHYVSARWPGDAYLLADTLLELLQTRREPGTNALPNAVPMQNDSPPGGDTASALIPTHP